MTGAEMVSQMQNAYMPSLIRRNTVWTFKAGKPVFLLREPGGPVWVLQEYTKAVDPGLTPDNLNELGGKLKNLPTRLDLRDQGADRGSGAGHGSLRRLGGHHSRRPALHLPGLRLRRRHQRELRALTLEPGAPWTCKPSPERARVKQGESACAPETMKPGKMK